MSYLYHYIATLPNGTECLKVGKGASPKRRMKDYTREHALGFAARTLRQFRMPSHRVARVFETEVHDRLVSAGYERVDYRSTRELFSMKGESADVIDNWIADTLDAFSAELAEFLIGDTDRFRTSLRRQRESAKHRTARKVTDVEKIRRTVDAPTPHSVTHRDVTEPLRRGVEVPRIQSCRATDSIEKLRRDRTPPQYHS